MLATANTRVNVRTLFRSEHLRNVVIPIHLIFATALVVAVHFGLWRDFSRVPLFWVLFSGFGIAVGYHRLLSHRAFATSVFWERALAFLGAMAGEGSPVSWVSTHRGLHHPFSDQEKDPHSPRAGFFHAYMGWQISVTKDDVNPRYAIDIIKDPFLRFISLHYYKVYWFTLAMFFVLNWRMALFSVVPAMVLSLHQENIINSFCHLPKLGYRNFELKDDSVNIWLLGTVLWGQGFHNNHHRFPRSHDFGVHWWEFDACRLIVWMIRTDRQKAVPAQAPAKA